MIAVDTNILMRLFIADTPAQAVAARRLVDEAAARRASVFVSSVVLAELCWALKKIYRFPKPDIVDALRTILDNDVFLIADRSCVEIALETWCDRPADFADYLIAAMARSAGATTTYTFDKDAAAMRPALTLLEA
jgi:predicted nucleic-acid-binding protein